jgi:hypothetical protein
MTEFRLSAPTERELLEGLANSVRLGGDCDSPPPYRNPTSSGLTGKARNLGS